MQCSWFSGHLACAALLLLPTSLTAGVAIAVEPQFPSTVAVGDTHQGALRLQNSSTSPNQSESVMVTSIKMTPSCGTQPFGPACSAGALDPGIFQYGATAIGRQGFAAAGIVFNITVIDASTGEVQFTPTSPFSLGPSNSQFGLAFIDFTFSVLKVPTRDASPGQPGIQTAQIGAASGQGTSTGTTGGGSGFGLTTVVRDTPSITTNAAPYYLGSQLSDTATIANGTNPTGTVTFQLYAPGDPTCGGAPVLISTNPVSAGSATSASFTPTVHGAYQWVATYNGDANNASVAGVCGEPTESVAVNVIQPISVAKSSNNVTVVFRGLAGNNYQVQFKAALFPASSWTTLPGFLTADSQGVFTFNDTTSDTLKFYRAIQ